MELQVANAQIQKTLSQVRTHEMELEADDGFLQAQLLAADLRETSLESSLKQKRTKSEETLAKLETVTPC